MSEPENAPSLQFYHITNTPRLPDTGANAVHFWASTDNLKLLEESGEKSLLVTDWFGNSPLHYAAACSSYICAEHIVKIFPTNHFFNQDKLTPAHIAAQRGDVRMLQILQKAEYLMTDVSECNWTILHFAVLYGHLESVKFILENCDNSMLYTLTDGMETILNSYQRNDFKFYSALDIAQIMKNKEMYDLLLTFHALPSLHSSIMSQNYRAITYFLLSPHSPHKNKLNFSAQYRRCTALHIAAAYDYYEICHSLLMCGASTDLLDVDGYSALDIALIHGATNSAQIILPKCSPERVSAAYCIALDLKITWIFNTFVNFKYDYIDKNGDSLLIRFIKRLTPDTYTEGTKKVANAILRSIQLPALLNTRDQYGATAFHYAAASEIFDFYNFLLNMVKDIDSPVDLNKSTILTYCVCSANRKSYQLINKRFNNAPDNFNMTPALYSLIDGMSDLPGLVNENSLNVGYNINIKGLRDFVNKPRVDSERKIFNYKTNETTTVNCPIINVYSEAFKENFDLNESKRMIQFFDKTDGYLYNCSFVYASVLLTKGKEIKSFTNLIDMVKKMNIQIDLMNHPDKNRRTPLMFAAMLRRYLHVSELINYGADIRFRDVEGNSVWHYVDKESVFKAIYDSRGGDVSITANDVNLKGETPLHIACKNGNLDVLKCFVRIIDDQKILTIPDKDGNTPLDNSLLSNSNNCIEYLHSKGVENRLITAIQNGCTVEEVEKLISHGYPVNSSDRLKNTPLHAAVQTKNISIASYLVSKGADVSAMNNNSKTPMHMAAQLGCLEIIKILLRNKIDMTALTLENQPFIFASEHKNIKDFLFNYWKRQYYGQRFIEDFIFKSKDTVMAIDMRANMFSLEGLHPDLDKSFKEIITKIIFVLKKIIIMRPRNPKPFSFMFSLHHLLLILTTIDLSSYQELVRKNLVKEGYTTEPQKSLFRTFLYLYPLRWMNYVSKFLEKLPNHLLQDVDDIGIVRNDIFNSINSQVAENNKIFEMMNGKINEYLETSKLRLPQKLYLNQIQMNQNNVVVISATVKIDEVSCDPTCIFYPQFSMYLKAFYGNQFILPRYIPFHNGNVIKVILFSNNTVAFVSTKDSNVYLVFPVELILVKTLRSEDIHVTTPIGSFNMVKYNNPQAPNLSGFIYSILTDALFFAQDTCVEYDEGESLMAGPNKEKNTYMCLVVYQLIGKKMIDLRMIILKADSSNECFDLVQSHISNSIPSGLVFLRVIPRLADKGDNTIEFV